MKGGISVGEVVDRRMGCMYMCFRIVYRGDRNESQKNTWKSAAEKVGRLPGVCDSYSGDIEPEEDTSCKQAGLLVEG